MRKNKTRKQRGGSPKHVAILFAGRIKAYEHSAKNFKDLQNKYNATVFCSMNKKIKSEYIKKFANLFNVKDEQLNLEPTVTPDWVKQLPKNKETSSENFYSTLYHKRKAFEMLTEYQKNHNMKFDCIIFMRADMDLTFTPPLNISLVKHNTLYIPEPIYDWSGLNDQMAYGDYETMKKYCELIDHIEKLCKEQGLLFHPETMMKKHVENSGLHLERFSHFYLLHKARHNHNPAHNDYE
jgi:hypothetical protein